ncbi:MAG: type II toxin-antitoxin system VapC family toxin [Candidatus Sulfotelmatobacter sp.]
MTLRVLLDTAILIFAVQSPERLSSRAVAVLENPENVRELSSVSLTEIAIKTTLGKLKFSAEFVRQAIQDMDIRILPFTAAHAYRLFDLPAHHRDPFDRQIIAQALSEDIPVVTSDEKFKAYEEITIVW